MSTTHQKYESFLCTFRPRCGLIPSEISSLCAHVSTLPTKSYIIAKETAHLGVQASHVHVLLLLQNFCRADNLKRSFVNACLSERPSSSYLGGVDIRPIREPKMINHYIGYLQKESDYECKGLTTKQLEIGLAFYLENKLKDVKNRVPGRIILTLKVYGTFILDYMERSLLTCPVIALQRMLNSGRYECAFASKAQRFIVLSYIGAGKPIPRFIIRHLLGACHKKCPECHQEITEGVYLNPLN